MTVRKVEVKVEQVPLGSLKAYDGNAKKHDNANIEAIENSIKEFGFRNPIIAWHNEDGVPEIVAGHGRALAAQKLGIQEVPVVFVDDLNDAQRRMLTLADNQTTLMTGWDEEQLALELDALDDLFNVSDFGFDQTGESGNDEYSAATKGLIYEPTGEAVSVDLLVDQAESDALTGMVEKLEGLTDKEREFCKVAARRFDRFDYESIAEYYASGSKQLKKAFEELKLVIIDRDGVIEKAAEEFVEVARNA